MRKHSFWLSMFMTCVLCISFLASCDKAGVSENFDVVFYVNGDVVHKQRITARDDRKISPPFVPLKAFSILDGWYTSSDCLVEQKFDFNQEVDFSLNLYGRIEYDFLNLEKEAKNKFSSCVEVFATNVKQGQSSGFIKPATGVIVSEVFADSYIHYVLTDFWIMTPLQNYEISKYEIRDYQGYKYLATILDYSEALGLALFAFESKNYYPCVTFNKNRAEINSAFVTIVSPYNEEKEVYSGLITKNLNSAEFELSMEPLFTGGGAPIYDVDFKVIGILDIHYPWPCTMKTSDIVLAFLDSVGLPFINCQ